MSSAVARGRITRIDTSAATRVRGVLTVLTHENRPSMADKDESWKDDVAPDGSPFRPLYDNRIMFNGQPIAVVRTPPSVSLYHRFENDLFAQALRFFQTITALGPVLTQRLLIMLFVSFFAILLLSA